MTVIRALSYLQEYAPIRIVTSRGEVLYSGQLGDAPMSSFSYGRMLESLEFDSMENRFIVVAGDPQR